MGGEEVLRRLRADDRTAATPIVILSADATPSQVDRLGALGASDYITKPFDIPRLLEIIDNSGRASNPVADRRTEPARASLDPAVIDSLHELAELSWDGTRQLRDLIDVFLRDSTSRIAELRLAIADDDGERIAELAHSLAGSSANLGAKELAEHCRTLQRGARAGERGTATATHAALSDAFDEAAGALRAEFFANVAEQR
jgi:HPt (histidine-containing phosphotransfer) domain-containing protein